MNLLEQLQDHKLEYPQWAKPTAATGTEYLQYYGAPYTLDQITNYTIDGQNKAIHIIGHGNGLMIRDCSDIIITNLVFEGPGQCFEKNDYYYALVLLAGSIENITFKHCVFRNSGEHGIGYLFGARNASNCTFEDCVFENIGNLFSASQTRDGAAIACGGRQNLYYRCRFIRCLRGIELETGDWTEFHCAGNTIEQCDFIEPLWHCVFIQPTCKDPTIIHDNYIGHNRCLCSGKDLNLANGTHQCFLFCTGTDSLQVENNLIVNPYQGHGMWFHAEWGNIKNVQEQNNRCYGLSPGYLKLCATVTTGRTNCLL